MKTATLDDEKKLETFRVSSLPVTGNYLPVIVNNTGTLPLNLTYAYMYPDDSPNDVTATPLDLLGNSTHTQVDDVLNPGESGVYLLDTPGDPTKMYHIKIISSRGNLMTTDWFPGYGSGGSGGQSGGSGNVTGALNVGTGNVALFVGTSGSKLEFKTLQQGSGVTVSSTNDTLTINAVGDGTGQNNTGINIGSGQASEYAGMSGDKLQFKKLVQGSRITLTNSSNAITISAAGDGVGQNNTGINIGSGDASEYAGMSGTKLQFKMLVQGTGISITNGSNYVRIGSTISPGEVNLGQVIGCGANNPVPADCQNVYAGKSGVNLQFYSLLAGTGVHITKSGNDLVISATGEANRGQNIGTGQSVYKGMNGVNLQFKKITGSGVISVTTNPANDTITIGSNQVGGSGQNNTGINIGSGQASVYAGMNGDKLQFKKIAQGTGITLTNSSNTVTIATTAQANDGIPLGCVLINPIPVDCQNVYAGMSGVHLQFYSLTAGTGIHVTSDGNGNLVVSSSVLGTITTAANVGAGTGQVYRDTTGGNQLNFRTLQGAGTVTVTTSGNVVTINNPTTNPGQGTGVLQLDFKSFGAVFPLFKTVNGIDQTGFLARSGNATGYPGFMLPTGPQTYLVERVRNLDPAGKTIDLGRSTGMTLSQGKCTGGQCAPVFLCNANIDGSGNALNAGISALNDPTTVVSVSPTSLAADQYTGWRDLLLCAHEQNSLNSWWAQAQMNNINSVFMVARGVYGGTNFEYAQTIPYQSIDVANAAQATNYANSAVTAPAMVACLRQSGSNTNAGCGSDPAVAGYAPPNPKYTDTAVNVRTSSQLWIHINSASGQATTGYSVSWIYPHSGKVKVLATNVNLNANNNVGGNAASSTAITLPTTMEDNVTPMQTGYYTIMVTSGYTGPDSGSNYNQGVFYFTFSVT